MSSNGSLESSVRVLLKEAFKLNSYEANVYAALLARPMSPKEISRTSKVPLPRVYDTLASLSEKGFVEETSGRYNAVNPLSALDSRITQFKSAFEKEQLSREEAKKRIVEALKPHYSKRIESTSDPVLLKGINSIGSTIPGTCMMQILITGLMDFDNPESYSGRIVTLPPWA